MYLIACKRVRSTELRKGQGIWRQVRKVHVLHEDSKVGHGDSFTTLQTVMKCWQIEKYGGIKELHLKDNVALPVIKNPSDVLIEVCASSVNPLDVVMCDGYGSQLFSWLKIAEQRTLFPTTLPLTLGRDFSGIVRNTGGAVTDFAPGDQVVGVIGAHSNCGAHAQYTLASSSSLLAKKPTNLSHVEAAALTYAGLTAWCALRYFGGLRPESVRNKRGLIVGGSGGVGSIAIQLMKAWGMQVTTLVSSDAIPLVTSLGADYAIDYTEPNWEALLKDMRGFDFVLNCTSKMSPSVLDLLKEWQNAKFVTLSSPLLRNINAFGLPLGVLNSMFELGFDNLKVLPRGQTLRWAYALPCKSGLENLMQLASKGAVQPVVEQVFPFERAPQAFEKVKTGHARGKTVISMERTANAASDDMETDSE